MKKISIIFALFVTLNFSIAQNVQWAFRVLDCSSQKESKAYSAKQVLGRPNVLPGSGENVNAWQPKGNRKEDFIKVGFMIPIKPKQIVIAESFNPGYIKKVLVYDADGNETELTSFQAKTPKIPSRLLSIPTRDLDFFVFAIKIVLKPENNLPVGIDAIGVSESEKHIEIKLNEADLVKSNMVVTKLDKNVNSDYSEFGPLLSPDGKTLYFSRRYDPNNLGGIKDLEDIWYSEWDDQTQNWGEAKNMGVPLNNKEPNFINSISPDGNTILLGNSYLPKGKMNGGTSISHRTPSGWSFPRRLDIEEEENLNEKTSYFLSNSQKILIMSVERRKENFGNRDLYVSFMKNDSTWTKPLNLGSNINTLGTESAPFLASDNRTLYFTSDGFAGYGGSDIYVTKRLDDTWQKWSEPENMGPVVNTSFNESFFTISAFGNKMYYTSEGTKDGDIDIYTLSLPSTMRPFPVVFVRGKVLDSKTMEPLPMSKILFENLETGLEMGIARSSPSTGEFAIVMPYGNNYGYLAEKEGYVSVHAHMDLAGLKENGEVRTDLYLTPIEVGQTIVLHNVFFDFGKYKLRKESYSELNRIVKLLNSNPNMKIEVSGHTDNVGGISFNDLLSFNRANAVTHYLLGKSKIESDRIVSAHYGEQNPVADNTTAKGRQLNRRVEFKILTK